MSDALRSNALQVLFQQNHKWLVSRLLRHADDAHDAQDLSSETFLRVVASPQDPSAITYPRAFLAKIGQRVVYRRLRERQIQQRIAESLALLSDDLAPCAETVVSMTQSIVLLDEALDTLPRPARQAFLMSQLDGMGYDAIAEQLHVSSRTVTRYIRQALLACMAKGLFQ